MYKTDTGSPRRSVSEPAPSGSHLPVSTRQECKCPVNFRGDPRRTVGEPLVLPPEQKLGRRKLPCTPAPLHPSSAPRRAAVPRLCFSTLGSARCLVSGSLGIGSATLFCWKAPRPRVPVAERTEAASPTAATVMSQARDRASIWSAAPSSLPLPRPEIPPPPHPKFFLKVIKKIGGWTDSTAGKPPNINKRIKRGLVARPWAGLSELWSSL